jgi:small-conductance mechanosensitive channel
MQENIDKFSNYFIYFGLLFILWLVFRFLFLLVRKYIKNSFVKKLCKQAIWSLVIFSVLFSGFILIGSDVGNILSIFGIFSAALVVALQDFVSSFFAFIFILLTNKYRTNDVISIESGGKSYTGIVKDFGILRTVLIEMSGEDQGFYYSKKTGKLISLANNLVIKGLLTNLTANGNTLSHRMSLTITFDTDLDLAETVTNQIIDDYFNPKYYIDNQIPLEYTTNIYSTIVDDGVSLTIWFPTKIGFLTQNLNFLNKNLLKAYAKNNIKLAYKTVTISK